MNFKEYLKESFFKGIKTYYGKYIEIYKNPSIADLIEIYKTYSTKDFMDMKIHEITRGFIDIKGNIYVWNTFIMHSDIIHEILNGTWSSDDKGNMIYSDDNDNRVISIHINDKKVYVGESDRLDDEIDKYYNLAKKKNPHFNYIKEKYDE